MNVFVSENLFEFGYLVGSKVVICQASIFGYHFPVGLQQKKGVPFSDEISNRKGLPDLVIHVSWEATNLVSKTVLLP